MNQINLKKKTNIGTKVNQTQNIRPK